MKIRTIKEMSRYFQAFTIVIVLMMTFMLTNAQAGRVKHRQTNQQDRIYQGIQSGELTRKEVKSLKKQQVKIARQKRVFLSDGHLTKKEKTILEVNQDKAGNRIYRLKHN